MTKLWMPLAAVLAASTLAAGDARASDLSQLSASEYYAATYFKDALEHPKIAKLKSKSAQIGAVARDLHMKPKALEQALAKVDALGGEPSAIASLAEKTVQAAAEKTRLKGRVLDVLVNAEEPKHVILYVRWQATTQREIVKEASTLANAVAETAPLVSTLSLAAIHPKAPATSKDPVWSAKISSASMAKIQKARIDEYGDRLYKRLFEGVEEKTF